MMQNSYQSDKTLQAAGLTPESIQAIKSTTVITRDGAQHVVPESQAHLDEAGQNEANVQVAQQVQDVSRMLSRHKQFSDQRIMKLEQHMEKLLAQVKDQAQTILTLQSNLAAQRKMQSQQPSLQESYAEEATEETTREIKNKPQQKQAIDRNKVAPADVQVENIFYSGTRR